MSEVTERDLRHPAFADGEPSDYEFRDDGLIVRKDRWEMTVRKIVGILGMSSDQFELPDIVEKVRQLTESRDERG